MADSEVGFTIVLNPLIDSKALTVTEKMVLISLLRYMNKERQRAWPSTRLLAENLGLSQLWVRRTLDRLEEKGLIKSEKKSGCVTRYEIFAEKLSYAPNSVTRVTELHTPSNTVTQCRVTELRGLSNSVTQTNTNTNTTLQVRNTNTKRASREKEFESDFEVFWQAYPKPQNPDKSPGRQKYIALRKKGVSAEDLLAAARGYAVAMRGTQPRYIKHCATFLGPQQAWKDFISVKEKARSGTSDEEEFMRDAFASGMISEQQYEEWRQKYGDRRLQTL